MSHSKKLVKLVLCRPTASEDNWRCHGAPASILLINFIELTKYNNLVDIICKIWPEVRVTGCKLCWVDKDSHRLYFTTGTQLRGLMDYDATGFILVVMRKEQLPLPPPYSESAPTTPTDCGNVIDLTQRLTPHRGVKCSGCQGKVYGFLYRCIQCKDYFLCMNCESQMVHKDHVVLRLSGSSDKINDRIAVNTGKILQNRHLLATSFDVQVLEHIRTGNSDMISNCTETLAMILNVGEYHVESL